MLKKLLLIYIMWYNVYIKVSITAVHFVSKGIYMIVHDITKEATTLPLNNSIPVVDLQWETRIDCGEDCNFSKIKMSSHAGTHIDTPYHFVDDGKCISDYPMSRFIGGCTVVTVNQVLTGEDMEKLLPRCKKKILFKGGEKGVLTSSAVYVMEDYGIELIGTENMSIAFEAEENKVNRVLAYNDVLLINNLNLSKINDGTYTLIALPLKIEGAEATQCRAILLEQEKGW